MGKSLTSLGLLLALLLPLLLSHHHPHSLPLPCIPGTNTELFRGFPALLAHDHPPLTVPPTTWGTTDLAIVTSAPIKIISLSPCSSKAK